MPYLSGNGNEFEQTINRGAGHFRSSELDGAVTAVKKYVKQPSAENITDVRNRLAAWRKANPKEYSDRGEPIYTALKAELVQHCQRWRVPSEPPASAIATVAATTGSSKSPIGWVNAVRAQIEELGRYDCADAYLGTPRDPKTGQYNYKMGFAGCIPVAKRPEMERRFDAMKKRGVGGAGTSEALFNRDRSWMAGNFQQAYNTARTNKAAICVQFAKSAAHLLTVNRPTGPRVEVVAFKNHVYVLVGRRGATPAGMVDPGWVNEDGVVIVDPWAGSLGYPTSIYPTYASYPLKGMVNPLKVVSERLAS